MYMRRLRTRGEGAQKKKKKKRIQLCTDTSGVGHPVLVLGLLLFLAPIFCRQLCLRVIALVLATLTQSSPGLPQEGRPVCHRRVDRSATGG